MQDVEQKPVTEPAEEAADVGQAAQPALDAEAAQEAAKEEAEKAESAQAEEALAAAVAKQEEYLAMAQRVQADFENFRRRNQNVRKEAFDDLERAILAAAESPDESLRSGVEMVYRQLCEAFEKRGITPIDRLGERFDPNLENAVMQGAPEDGEPGTVCAVLQKGYQMEGMVLRHAMVKVVPE